MPPTRVRSRPLDALVGHLGDRRGRLHVYLQPVTSPPRFPSSPLDPKVYPAGRWMAIPVQRT